MAFMMLFALVCQLAWNYIPFWAASAKNARCGQCWLVAFGILDVLSAVSNLLMTKTGGGRASSSNNGFSTVSLLSEAPIIGLPMLVCCILQMYMGVLYFMASSNVPTTPVVAPITVVVVAGPAQGAAVVVDGKVP